MNDRLVGYAVRLDLRPQATATGRVFVHEDALGESGGRVGGSVVLAFEYEPRDAPSS